MFNSIAKSDLSAADYLSLLPIYQQFIGGYCMLVKSMQIIANLADRVFKEIRFSLCNSSTQTIEAFRKLNNESRAEYIDGFVLNVLRFIPIIGTLVSAMRIRMFIINPNVRGCLQSSIG